MLPVFESLKSLVRLRVVTIDNPAFQLHYRWTVAILLSFSILLTLKQFWGDAIFCHSSHKKDKIVDTFCWTEVTYTIPSAYNLSIGIEVPYPGIVNSRAGNPEKKFHAYYQWVGLMLFLQGILFCIPRFIWKSEEGGLVKRLVCGLDAMIMNEDKKEKLIRLIVYLKASKGSHNIYVIEYLVCEILNFVNVVGQLVLMEQFIGGELSSYVMQVLGLQKDSSPNPTFIYPGYKVFPRITKCQFHDFGPTGDLKRTDALCLLPLNILNEKIYTFIFLWFVMLTCTSGFIIFMRLVTILQFEVRESALESRSPLSSKKTIQELCAKYSFCDWFFLKLICKNVSSQNSNKIVDAMNNNLSADDYMKQIERDDEITHLS